MAIIKCKMCGGDLDLIEGQSVAECEYCGSRQTVPTADNEKKLTLFARANRLRAACEFDKAAGIYESIVTDFPEEAEAYWGLVLCKYGIEYVDDPATGKKIPTCHRSSFDSILEDADFEQAMENADAVARRVYREESKQIEEIRKGIIAVSSNEEPYDIFICYKETDENGDRTLDSVLAQDIYDAVTAKGYRTFFARITLEDKLGVEYEPYIFAALHSAKIMLAVGTDYEYYNAVWVKNEWSRYLKLMAKDKDKHLIPCFKNLDAYDMPKEFARLQAQDLGKVGAMQDLLRGIEKILPKAAVVSVVKETILTPTAGAVDPLLKRVFIFLEDSDWKSANEYCEKVLDIDPENALAYVGKLMAELCVPYQNRLKNQQKPFDDKNNYQKAIRFADSDLRQNLESDIAYIKQRMEEERIAQKKRDEQARIKEEKRKEEERRAREKREKEDRAVREQKIEALKVSRAKLRAANNLLSAGSHFTVGLKTDGTVLVAGNPPFASRKLASWNDIVSVNAGTQYVLGVTESGTVLAVGENKEGRCNVQNLQNVVDAKAGGLHMIALKGDHSVSAVGWNYFGQCYVKYWLNIAAIDAFGGHSVGLKADGTVKAVGFNKYGQCNVDKWNDIVAISSGFDHTVGLKADGTVLATGFNEHGECRVNSWKDIVAVSAGIEHTVGLKQDGTVVATGSNENGQCNVTGWRNIIAVRAGGYHTVGLKKDGTLVLAGRDQNEVSTWRLFESFENIREERETARENAKQRKIWQEKNLCQYCGGELKGLFTKKCVNCGKPKDY